MAKNENSATPANAGPATPANAGPATPAKVEFTLAQLKAAFQHEYDAKPTSGQKAAFTKRLEAMGVSPDLMPKSKSKESLNVRADDLIISALLAKLKA